MRLSKLTIRNYRQLREIDVSVGALTLLGGEHASGKTNLLQALRLLFDPTQSYEERLPTLADFGDYGDGAADAITIQVEIALGPRESASFADPLYISAAEPNTARMQFVANRRVAGISVEITGGDGVVPKCSPWQLFAVAYVDGDLPCRSAPMACHACTR